MQWWAWIAVGAILLGSELTLVDAQFYLVFVGASALVVGFAAFADWGLAVWAQWLLFTALAVVSMLTFRRRIYERMRRNLPVMNRGPAGETVVLLQALPPGAICRLEFRGSSWNALNGGQSIILAGGRATIERVDGLTLVLRPEA